MSRRQRVRIDEGEPFVVGGTTLVLRLASSFDGSADDDPVIERGGGLLFNRSPRVELRYPGTQFKPPRLPTEKIGKVFPWPILVAPILMGVALYALNGNPRSLLMIVMTLMMAFGNMINQSVQSKRSTNHGRFARLCKRLGLRHMRTRPYTPRTNGKG